MSGHCWPPLENLAFELWRHAKEEYVRGGVVQQGQEERHRKRESNCVMQKKKLHEDSLKCGRQTLLYATHTHKYLQALFERHVSLIGFDCDFATCS